MSIFSLNVHSKLAGFGNCDLQNWNDSLSVGVFPQNELLITNAASAPRKISVYTERVAGQTWRCRDSAAQANIQRAMKRVFRSEYYLWFKSQSKYCGCPVSTSASPLVDTTRLNAPGDQVHEWLREQRTTGKSHDSCAVRWNPRKYFLLERSA